MRKTTSFLFCVCAFLFVVSCQKGDTGAQGPAGPQGPQGPQGNTGSANVIYSDWLTTTAFDWKDTTLINFGRCQRTFKTAGALTQNILDSGVILVYLRDAFNTTYALPLTYNLNPARVHNFIPQVGKFLFFEYATDGTGGFVVLTNKYRYILIPGGVRTGGRNRDWKEMKYAEVCETLGIPL